MNYETMDLHFIWCSVSIILETFNLFCYWNSRDPRLKAQCLLVALCGLWKRHVRCRYTGPWICGRHGDHPPCNCPTEEGPTFVSSVACPLQRPTPDRGSLRSAPSDPGPALLCLRSGGPASGTGACRLGPGSPLGGPALTSTLPSSPRAHLGAGSPTGGMSVEPEPRLPGRVGGGELRHGVGRECWRPEALLGSC